VKKNRLNRLEFLKNRSVQFDKSETEKTKMNRTQTQKNRAKPEKPSQKKKNQVKPKKPRQTKKTGFCSKITEPKPTGLNRFRFGFSFF
jgi:hypothetical protein